MAPQVRVRSIDVLRGAVMVLMALDHVRVYAGVPAGGPDPGVFFTRWVTHFCAPLFVFLSGTSAYLSGRTSGDVSALSWFLLTRGLLLIVLEVTVIKAAWTFALDYSTFVLAGVIWMLGGCMVVMAGLVRLPMRAIGALGIAMMAGHQVFGLIPGGWPWELIYPSGHETPAPLVVLYSLVPWVGVMAAGYAFGVIVNDDPARRDRWCLRIGLSATVIFIASAIVIAATTPADARLHPVLTALNQNKYPPSQLFLLMTLGPAIALMPFAERARGRVLGVLDTFGRVPMFYYLCHIPLIHAMALGVGWMKDGAIHPEWFATAPYTFLPPEYRWNLGLLYLVWGVAVAALYPACRWFMRRKATRRPGWLRYI